tara:strand:- start:30748 stop:37875 length:7128 start_codon:yes stop_codon:yes gene_type:complete
VANIKASEQLVEFIKQQESFRAEPYDDVGTPAIGYGSRRKENVALGTITEEQALQFLREDIAEAEALASKQITNESLTQGQMDVIVDMFFNVRARSRKGTVKLINAGDIDEAYVNIGKITKAENPNTGEMEDLGGLVKRARARQDMFLRDNSYYGKPVNSDLATANVNPGIEKERLEKAALAKTEPIETKGHGASGTFGEPDVTPEEVDKLPEQPIDQDLADLSIDDDVNAAIDSVMSGSEEPKPLEEQKEIADGSHDVDIDFAIDDVMVKDNKAREQDLVKRSRDREVSPLKDAQAISQESGLDTATVAESSKFAKETGMGKEDALAHVKESDYESKKADKKLQKVSESNPNIKKWGSKPENFQVLMSNPDGFKKLDDVDSPFIDDMKTILEGSPIEFREANAHLQAMLGLKSKEEALKELDVIDHDRKLLPALNSAEGMKEIQKDVDKMSEGFRKLVDSVNDADAIEFEDMNNFAPAVGQAMLDAGHSAVDVLRVMGNFIDNPKAMMLTIAQSQRNSLLGIGLGTLGAVGGGTTGFFTPVPFGALAGAGVGYRLGDSFGEMITSFSTKLREEMQAAGFGNNYRAFYADPVAYEKAKNKALKYSGLMSTLNFFMLKFAGKNTAKAIQKAAIAKGAAKISGVAAKGAAKDISKSLVKDTAIDTGLDVTREFTSRVTPLPGVEGDEVAGALTEAAEEGIFGVGGSAATSTVAAVARVQLEKHNTFKKIKILHKEYTQAESAEARKSQYDKTRQALNEMPEANGNPEQVKEFIKEKFTKTKTEEETVKTQDMEDDLDLASEEDLDIESDELIADETDLAAEHEEEINSSVEVEQVRINTTDWINHFVEQGLEPLDEIEKLGPEYVAAFVEAEEFGTELSVPVDEFLIAFKDDEDVASIVRFGEEIHNANEAKESKQAVEAAMPEVFSKTPVDGDGESKEEGPEFIFPEGEPEDGDVQLRRVQLLNKYKSAQEQKVIKDLFNSMRRLIKNTPGIDNRTIEAHADVQFRRLRQRSAATGIPISDLASRMKFSSAQDLRMWQNGKQYVVRGLLRTRTALDKELAISRDTAGPGTLLHELGHAWLGDMMEDYEHMQTLKDEDMSQEQKDYKHAMVLTAEMLGLSSVKELQDIGSTRSLDKKVQAEAEARYEKAQETFAQTTEKYFLEGKFKTSKIRTLMEYMRRFLKPFSKDIGTAYPEFPAPVIDESIERMFEGILGTSELLEKELFPMFPELELDLELFGPQTDAVIEARLNARDEAIGEFVSNIQHREFRQREKLIKAAKKKIKQQAEEAVANLESVRLVKAIKDASKDGKISTESFIAAFGEEAVAQVPKGILSGKKRKGVDVTEFMSLIGRDDKIRFLQLLREAANVKDLQAKAEAFFTKENFPIFKSDEEIHHIAVEAANGHGARRKLLRLEMKALAEKSKANKKKIDQKLQLAPGVQRRMLRANMEQEARQLAYRMNYKNFKPGDLLKDSDRHSRDSVKFYRDDDIDAALESKQLQILNFEAYKYAKKLDKQIRKVKVQEKLIAKSNPKKTAKTHDQRGINLAKQIVKDFKRGAPLTIIDVNDLPSNTTVYSKGWGDFINDKIRQINERLDNTLLKSNADAGTYLAYGELLASIKTSARLERIAIVQGRAMAREDIRAEIIEDITTDKKGELREPIKRDDGGEGYFVKQRKDLERMRESFSGMYRDKFHFAKSSLFKMLNTVMDAEAEFTLQREEGFNNIYDKFTKGSKERRAANSVIFNTIAPFGKRAGFKKVFGENEKIQFKIGDKDFTLSRSELLAMLLHTGSESNLRHLLLGGIKGSGPLVQVDPTADTIDTSAFFDMLDGLIEDGTITQSDMEAVQTVWDFMEEHYEPSNNAFEYMNGHRFGKINHKPVKTKFDTYKGGYFPLFQDDAYKDLGKSVETMVSNYGAKDFNELMPSSDLSFTHARGAMNELSLRLDHIPYAMHRILQLEHLSVPLFEFGKVLGDKEISAALESRQPGIIKEVAIPWMDRTMSQQYNNSTLGLQSSNFLARDLREGMQIHTFTARVSSSLVQLTGFSQSLTKLKTMLAMEAGVEAAMSPRKTRAYVADKSKRMKARLDGGQRRMLQHYEDMDLNGDWIDASKKSIQSATFYTIQVAQNQVDVTVWTAAYREAIQEGFSEQDAVGHADTIVEQTQGSSAISNRSAFEQSDQVMKMFLAEYSTVRLMKYHQYLEADRQTVDDVTMARFQRKANVVLLTALIPGMTIAMMGGAWDGLVEGEKDHAKIFRRMSLDAARELVDLKLPIIGGPALQLASNVLAKSGSSGVRTSPAVELLGSQSLKAGRAMLDTIFTDGGANSADLPSLFYMATVLTKIPFSPIGRVLDFAESQKSDKVKRREKAIRRRKNRKQNRSNR